MSNIIHLRKEKLEDRFLAKRSKVNFLKIEHDIKLENLNISSKVINDYEQTVCINNISLIKSII